jgi:hypothetical protein
VPSSIVTICAQSLCYYNHLSFVAFESDSELSVIERGAFAGSALKSICIPAGVQTLIFDFFSDCSSLASVVFEFHSRLVKIRSTVFLYFRQLQSICLPASLEWIEPEALPLSSLFYIGIETGNRHFIISGGCLLVFDETSIVGHSGFPTEVSIGNVIEELCDACFLCQESLSIVSFEPNSRLRRIGAKAFLRSSLRCIDIPSNVETIGQCCFSFCRDLSIVRFALNSRLCAIEQDAFECCGSLETIWIPSHLQTPVLRQFEPCPPDHRFWHKFQVIIIETELIIDLYMEEFDL